ncbi:MAG TPA: UDP-glucose--hexose-1-phosphate uridylyltransferase [Candidatus Dormibacteraeota bacterium]|nr:UDP-glucose--hexose-1-phosphate uridylyltransferase [Candidatus Dormibacteraeota bacterium]
MKQSELEQLPHRRFNPLKHKWVLVSPHRTERPWQGKVEKASSEQHVAYDPTCYLCPGNERAGGARNSYYANTFVFDNDYPALLPNAPEAAVDEGGLIVGRTERGTCRVVCFSPRHDLTIARMNPVELRQVVDVWVEEYQSLGARPWISYVQIFENRGAIMGASNPHPHCQIWANHSLPNEPAEELAALQEYRKRKGSCLLCDYLNLELRHQERIICENSAFVAVVPYWAIWPFEVLVLSVRHLSGFDELSNEERDLLGDILKRLTTRYDNLFEISFPYSMGFHQRPTNQHKDQHAHRECHFHAHYYPPLLRSATIQKFMVGYEMLATPQRDITPETAAARLRDAGEVHYRDRNS